MAKNEAEKLFSDGLSYLEGLGVAVDHKTGVALISRSAFLGYPQAQVYLASLYMKGTFGVSKSESSALYWYSQYAKQGDVSVQKFLGRTYAAKKDGRDKAIEWYTLAAATGDEDAIAELNKLQA